MGGLVSYGAYIPYYRLERGRIAGVLGSGGGRGTRAVAGYDEDTTSMAVEAGRAAFAGLTGPGAERDAPRQLFFATSVPAYADKTNATAVHAALRLPADALAVDMAGAVRSGAGALIAAAQSPVPAMAVLSDIRTGLPGSADERDGEHQGEPRRIVADRGVEEIGDHDHCRADQRTDADSAAGERHEDRHRE